MLTIKFVYNGQNSANTVPNANVSVNALKDEYTFVDGSTIDFTVNPNTMSNSDASGKSKIPSCIFWKHSNPNGYQKCT